MAEIVATRVMLSVAEQKKKAIPVVDVDALRTPIRDYLSRLTQSSAKAEDLTQEVFVRVHRNLSSLRDTESLKAWIYRIASNVFLDDARSASGRMERTSVSLDAVPAWSWEENSAEPPDEASFNAEQAACIKDYIHALPASYRSVLVMRDMQGLTNKEVAEVLGCSLETAKIRLHRARRRLKTAMDTGCDISTDAKGSMICEPKSSPSDDSTKT